MVTLIESAHIKSVDVDMDPVINPLFMRRKENILNIVIIIYHDIV